MCSWVNQITYIKDTRLFDGKHCPIFDVSGEIAGAESSSSDDPALNPMHSLQIRDEASVSTLGRRGGGGADQVLQNKAR